MLKVKDDGKTTLKAVDTFILIISDLIQFKNCNLGLSWWSSGQETHLPMHGYKFDPWSGRIPHGTGQPNPCTTSTEPVLHNKRSHPNEKPMHGNKE